MLLRLILLLIVVPLLELAVLIKVGHYIGVGETIAIVVLAGMLGAWLVRHQGLRTWNQIRSELAAGHVPGDRLVDGLLILVAGVLLVTPGLITDAMGFLLLIPPLRSLVGRVVKARFRSRFVILQGFGRQGNGQDDFVDVEARPAETHRSAAGQLPEGE